MHNQPDELKNYAYIYGQKVIWGEMDALGHLNNVVYYRYAETARIHYLEKLGMFNKQSFLVLAQASCKYILPVVYPDTLQIGVRCKKIGTTSIVFEYLFYSQQQQKTVATAQAVVVNLDKETNKSKPWSEQQRQDVFALEQTVNHIPEH